MNMDFYAILGITDCKASQDEIKRAYRACARECHPDKCNNDPIATDRMKQVNEAFETLRDPHKRFIYDAARSSNMGTNAFEGIDWGMLTSFIEKLVAAMPNMKKKAAEECKAKAKNAKQTNVKIPPCINVDLVVNLHEMCKENPPVKKIGVKVLRYSKDATRRVIERTYVYVPLYNYKDTYMFEEEGDELRPGVFGDICVKLVVKPHESYHIDKILNPFDLYYEKNVTLYDYVYGLTEVVNHIDDETQFTISYKGGDKVQIVRGRGIHYTDPATGRKTRGDLYVMFDLCLPLPESISKKEDELVRNVIASLSTNL